MDKTGTKDRIPRKEESWVNYGESFGSELLIRNLMDY